MARLILFIAFSIIALVSATSNDVQQLGSKVIVVDNFEKYAATQNLVSIQELKPTKLGNVDFYILGYRIPGDRLVYNKSDSYKYVKQQDVKLQITYPEAGQGSVQDQEPLVTFVVIIVSQISSVSNAYVVAGGIGKQNVSIIVEAKHTLFFAYDALIFAQ